MQARLVKQVVVWLVWMILQVTSQARQTGGCLNGLDNIVQELSSRTDLTTVCMLHVRFWNKLGPSGGLEE